MNYPLYLGRRLALGGDGRKASPGVKVAIAAIALSVAVMTASIAITLGFKREITDKVVGFTSHIIMTIDDSDGGDNLVNLTPSLRRILDGLPCVADYSLQISLPAILKTPGDFKGVILKNLDDSETRRFIKSNLISGEVPDYSADSTAMHVVMSRIAASQLGLKQNDKVDCFFINSDVKVRRIKIAGIYDSHFDAYDNLMLYGSRKLSEAFCGFNANQGTSLLITTDDFRNIDESTVLLRDTLNHALAEGILFRQYNLENAHVGGASYFHWLRMLDTNVAVVLALMMIVGCVTLISGMLTIILDKKKFIGLMKALGTPNSKLRLVFVYLAMRVAIIGMAAGNILVLALLWLQDRFHFMRLDASSYYIDFVPVQLDWTAILVLNAGVLLVIFMSLLLPSRLISRISPSETLCAD